ncbi:MAG: type II/IV secretion system ATPase subunit [Candidatus Woesearchaeota archaeon]
MVLKRIKAEKTLDLDEARVKYPHLDRYLKELEDKGITPDWYQELNRNLINIENINIIYPVGDPIFIHLYKDPEIGFVYHVIEPRMSDRQKKVYDQILDKMIEIAGLMPVPKSEEEVEKILIDLLNEVVSVEKPPVFGEKIVVSREDYEMYRYYIVRDRIGYGKLTPLFFDSWLEDIHCVGVGSVKVVHKIFGTCHTNIIFEDDIELNKYILETSERVEKPASSRHSVVDAIMPDGSRVNFIYGRDISLEGSSFTIRKFFEVPVSVTQLIDWGTLSAREAAYLWIAIEFGMNIFVCGETAAGKTTTLNALAAFIVPEAKVYSVENTPEVKMPHEIWQHLVTREQGKASDVTYQDLLIAALRSRPNYIIVGEIRGVEGNIAFQAMQTGHPVMSTFHAGSVESLVQRLTGVPINVPIASIDNLNIVVIQSAVRRGNRSLRRVISITEIERYYAPENKVITRQVFKWDPASDEHIFQGMYNSFILEKKIGTMMGLADTREIYKLLHIREKILLEMVKNKIFDYYEVWRVLKLYRHGGLAALPFPVIV